VSYLKVCSNREYGGLIEMGILDYAVTRYVLQNATLIEIVAELPKNETDVGA